MQPMNTQELDRRISTFLDKKHREYPELRLRRQEPKRKKHLSIPEVFSELVAGANWEFGR